MATRKVASLLKRGARVTCVSRDFSKSLKAWAKRSTRQLVLKAAGKSFRPAPSLFRNASLVIAATSDRDFNRRVAEAGRKRKIWVNAVDDPEYCDFYAPAVVRRGPLQIAISTNGTSPLFAKRLREALETVIPNSTGRILAELGEVRRLRRLLKENGNTSKKNVRR